MGTLISWTALRRRFSMGRVATIMCALAIITTAGACSTEEASMTAATTKEKTPIGVNVKTGRPECNVGESITLSQSLTRTPQVRSVSPWGRPTLTIEAMSPLVLVGVLATQGSDLHGFYNLTPAREISMGGTITIEARQFTVAPDVTETMTALDSVTLCVQTSI